MLPNRKLHFFPQKYYSFIRCCVSVFSEQYEEAIRDFTACLTIQKEILEADNRLLAETYPF